MSTPASPADALVLDFLRDVDVPCPVCAYNLRNLTQPRCPECGEHLHLRIVLAEARIALWLAAVLPLFFTAGIGLLFLFLLCTRNTPSNATTATVIYLYVASLPLAIAAAFSRRLFYRLPAVCRYLAAVALVAATLALLLVGAYTIR